MRLWHYSLLENNLLPKSQLIAQWRELNSVFAKQDNHILINYIYDYDETYLAQYTKIVLLDMQKRGYSIKKWDNFNTYFFNYEVTPASDFTSALNVLETFLNDDIILSYNEHDDRYLLQCFMNLQEKYYRKQKDFSKQEYNNLYNFVSKKINVIY